MLLLSSADFFQINFHIIFSVMLLGCQTDCIQIRTKVPDLGLNYLQRLSAEDKLPLAKLHY